MKTSLVIILLSLATILINYIRTKVTKTHLQKFIATVLYTISYTALAFGWRYAYFHPQDGQDRKTIAYVMFIASLVIAITQALVSLALLHELPKSIFFDNAEKLINKLQKKYDECSLKYSAYVGTNNVLKELSLFLNHCRESNNLTTSTTQLFSSFLPQYLDVYSNYVDTIAENIRTYELPNSYTKQMLQCSEHFLITIEHVKQEQELLEADIQEQEKIAANSNFEAKAEAFHTMIETYNEIQDVTLLEQRKTDTND